MLISNHDLTSMLQMDLGEKGQISEFLDEVVVTIEKDQLLPLAEKLISEKYNFNYLTNLTAVDYPDNYTIVYNFRSLKNRNSLVLRVEIEKENPQVPTLFNVWKTADWQEREVFDLLGIHFTGHPEMKRILLPDDFNGYPLRKDYALQARR